jgi:hypothetical protein
LKLYMHMCTSLKMIETKYVSFEYSLSKYSKAISV